MYTPFALAANKAGTKPHLVNPDSKQDPAKLPFVYPYGCSLDVKHPAQTLLSTGFISYPLNRPVAAVAETEASEAGKAGGRICVVGAGHMFNDEFYIKESNLKVRAK